jgi:hypothetical protein
VKKGRFHIPRAARGSEQNGPKLNQNLPQNTETLDALGPSASGLWPLFLFGESPQTVTSHLDMATRTCSGLTVRVDGGFDLDDTHGACLCHGIPPTTLGVFIGSLTLRRRYTHSLFQTAPGAHGRAVQHLPASASVCGFFTASCTQLRLADPTGKKILSYGPRTRPCTQFLNTRRLHSAASSCGRTSLCRFEHAPDSVFRQGHTCRTLHYDVPA